MFYAEKFLLCIKFSLCRKIPFMQKNFFIQKIFYAENFLYAKKFLYAEKFLLCRKDFLYVEKFPLCRKFLLNMNLLQIISISIAFMQKFSFGHEPFTKQCPWLTSLSFTCNIGTYNWMTFCTSNNNTYKWTNHDWISFL